MLIFPAIDLYEGKAVRLFKGDYSQMTVYSEKPVEVAKAFAQAGAACLHMVDLEGAKTGDTPNCDTIREIAAESGLFTELGGGIRSLETIEKYLESGVNRVILGTAAVTQEGFAKEAVKLYGEKIAVGVDIRDGFVAVKGWMETTEHTCREFCKRMQADGVRTIICTDISRDGAMRGTNRELYGELSALLKMNIIASGGVSSIDDVRALAKLGIYGAIIGKAYYNGAIDLKEAIKEAGNQRGEV